MSYLPHTDDDRRARLAERARQVRLARERGDTHIGAKLEDDSGNAA